MYTYKNLVDMPMPKIVKAFNLAFADYAMEINFDEKYLTYLFEISAVDYEFSYGAFYEGELIGFIFNAHSIYNCNNSVFDIATAILPQHRGKGVFSELFKQVETHLLSSGITHYYLQVLQQNKDAIAKYNKKGFEFEREFIVLKYKEEEAQKLTFKIENIKDFEYNDFDYTTVKNCKVLPFAFEYNTDVLSGLKKEYSAVIYAENSEITAFCVCSKKGDIAQIGYTKLDSLEHILKFLIAKFQVVSARNIDMRYELVINLLLDLGFKEQARQYEMVKNIK